jgi:hypothetical protein
MKTLLLSLMSLACVALGVSCEHEAPPVRTTTTTTVEETHVTQPMAAPTTTVQETRTAY